MLLTLSEKVTRGCLMDCYLFIYLSGAKKADRFTVVIESMQGLLKKCCECTFYIKVVK